jgi:DNA repair exonuclease SbcCD ATPase subunit
MSSKRPVAFRVKDFADGWILFQDEEQALALADSTGALMQGLYVREGTASEQTWEQRWIKAVATLADRDDEIEQLKAQYARLEQMWNARPTGTRSQRESQLEKRMEESEALAFQLAEQVNQAKSELAAAEKWRQQFDCCMCGSRMDAHDIGSGHSPVSMYDYHMGQLEQQIEHFREALTPSSETKVAYMGEFSVPWPEVDPDGHEYIRRINVPWVTIKEIMKAILARAEAKP